MRLQLSVDVHVTETCWYPKRPIYAEENEFGKLSFVCSEEGAIFYLLLLAYIVSGQDRFPDYDDDNQNDVDYVDKDAEEDHEEDSQDHA